MHCVCVVRSRSCRLPARNEKEREKKKREREREGQPSPAARRKGRGCVCARAGRGEERDAAPMLLGPEPRVRGGGREGGVSRGQSFAPPPPAPNNLLVFHVRFDSLSFRYLYLPGPLRISGISGISRAWGLGRRRGEREKRKK